MGGTFLTGYIYSATRETFHAHILQFPYFHLSWNFELLHISVVLKVFTACIFPVCQPSEQMVDLVALVAFAFCDATTTVNAAPSPTDGLPPALPSDDYPYDESLNNSYPDYYDDDDIDYNGSRGYYDEEYDDYRGPTVDPEVRKRPCPGRHTHRDRWGYCTCDNDYWHGNPDTTEGCWKCNDTCHTDATCVYLSREMRMHAALHRGRCSDVCRDPPAGPRRISVDWLV